MSWQEGDQAAQRVSITHEEIAELLKRKWNKTISRSAIRRVLIEDGFIFPPEEKHDCQLSNDLFEVKDEELPLFVRPSNSGGMILNTRDLSKQITQNQIEQSKEDEATNAEDIKDKRLSFYSPAERTYLNHLEQGVFIYSIVTAV